MENQKDKFSLQEGSTYLNCAYMSPLLIASEIKGREGMLRKRNPFEITPADFFEDSKMVKSYFSQILHTNIENIALFPSVSYGFASVLNNISANQKKNVLVVENEFPSGYFAAKKWCEENSCVLNVVKANDALQNRNEIWNETILQQIDAETAFVLISSVHWMDGCVFDLQKIGAKCKLFGAKLLVDGTQSVGALKIEVDNDNIDFLVCATYKWLFGPYSSAIGYFSSDFFEGKPLEESWMNRDNAHDFTKLTNYSDNYAVGASRYNVGQTNDFIKLPMLQEALRQVVEWKADQIQNYCEKLIQPLVKFLEIQGISLNLDSYQAKHLIGFPLAGKFDEKNLQLDLKEHKIYLSTRGSNLRISPNVYNSEEDIEKLLKVLSKHVLN